MFVLVQWMAWVRVIIVSLSLVVSSPPIWPCVRAFSLSVEGGHRQRPSGVGYAYELRHRSPARGLSVQVPTPVSPQVTTARSRIPPMPLTLAPAALATNPSVAVGAFGFPDPELLFQLRIGQKHVHVRPAEICETTRLRSPSSLLGPKSAIVSYCGRLSNVRAGNEDGGVINWACAPKPKESTPPPWAPPPENVFAVLEISHMERWKTSGLCASDPPVFETKGVRVEKSSPQECVIKIAIR